MTITRDEAERRMRGKKRDLPPPHPGEILKHEFLEPMGITANFLADHINVPAGRVSQIINGKRAITADTALRLAQAFGTSAEMWMNLQSLYELQFAQMQESDIAGIPRIKAAG